MKTNTTSYFLVLIAMVCAASSTVLAQKPQASKPAAAPARTALSAEADAFHTEALQKAAPPVRRWIAEQARLEMQKNTEPEGIEPSLRAAVSTRFNGQMAGQMEIDMVTLITYVEMVKSIAQQIDAGRKQIGHINTAMTSLRSMLKGMEADVAKTAGKPETDKCMSPLCGGVWIKQSASAAEAQRQAGDAAPFVASEIATIGDLRARVEDVKSKLVALDAKGNTLAAFIQTQVEYIEKLQKNIDALMAKIDKSEDHKMKALK